MTAFPPSPTLTPGCGVIYYNAYQRTLSVDGKSWVDVLDSYGHPIPDTQSRYIEVWQNGQLVGQGFRKGVDQTIEGFAGKVEVRYAGNVYHFDLSEKCSTTSSTPSTSTAPTPSSSPNPPSSTSTILQGTSTSGLIPTKPSESIVSTPLPVIRTSSELPFTGPEHALTFALLGVGLLFTGGGFYGYFERVLRRLHRG